MKLSEKIKFLREERGMSQTELAKAAGYISRSSISKIEKGESDPSQKMLSRIAAALGVKPSELISEENAKSPPQGEPVYLKHGDVRILAKGFDRMPEEERRKALELARMVFEKYASYFEEGADDDDENP